ncbi:MAG: hypothetical protein LLF84_00075 [Methanoregulaceae archaeon]|jgi:hypothetical protein|nr:hypothetical protein [Methanoregulaceae archaeon]
MRKKIFTLVLIVIVWGMMGIIPPVSALPPEEDLLPLYEGISDNRIGTIVIDPANAHYAILANVGEQKGALYYELKAHNPSGVPVTITWGMIKANKNGYLRCQETFDSITLTWIKNYGLNGAIYSVRPL